MIVFDDAISHMLNNKKLNLVVTEWFIRGRKLNIPLVFITQSYFSIPDIIRLNSTHYCNVKISDKQELNKSYLIIHHILTLKTYEVLQKITIKPYSFLAIDGTLSWDNHLHFTKNLLERI